MFAGVGGFRLGLERAGWRCVGWCEVDKFCQRVYRHRFSDAGWFWPDATTLDPSQMPDFDFLVAGVPCQAWSVAGKRRGFEDARGTLWFDCFRILEGKKPKGFVFENVKGLVCRPFRDREFKRILQILRGLGYLVFWRVLNSKNYGVPQNRERVFIVGFRHGGLALADFTWPEPKPLTVRLADVLEREVPEKYYLPERTLECLRRHLERHRAKGHGFGFRIVGGGGVSNTLSSRYHKDGSENLVMVHASFPDGARVYGSEAPTISTPCGGRHLPFVVNTQGKLDEEVAEDNPVVQPCPIRFLNRNQRRFDPDTAMTVDTSNSTGVMVIGNIYPSGGDAGGIYPTVKQGKRGGKAGMPPIALPRMVSQRTLQRFDGIARTVRQDLGRNVEKPHNPVLLPDMRVRRLTPRECERLQGFPDDWTRWGVDESGKVVEISDTQRYKMMGNAVTVPVVEALGRAINAYTRALGWV
jgi:DNA (cytosine-5)-methyltransferase 1